MYRRDEQLESEELRFVERQHVSSNAHVEGNFPAKGVKPAGPCQSCHAERSRGISRFLLAADK